MITCFEGPSAVGKSTMCRSLSERFKIIPEANEVFERAFPEQPDTYLELQRSRYELSASSQRDSILDGDILQPLWYGWTYGFPAEYQSFEVLTDFYADAFDAGSMGFPDLYILYSADIETLRLRRSGDATRSRRSFEKHLSLVESQRRYFEFLSRNTTVAVQVIEYDDYDAAREQTLERIAAVSPRDHRHDLQDLGSILEWISTETFEKVEHSKIDRR